MNKNFKIKPKSNEKRLFASVDVNKLPVELQGDKNEMKNSIGFRIPSLLSLNCKENVLLAFSDCGNDGGDWGAVGIACRRSENDGESFDETLKNVVIPVTRKQPYTDEDWSSAFFIDPLAVETKDGNILLMSDFFPESRGLHSMDYLESGTGFDEKGRLILTSKKAPFDNGVWETEFYVNDDGFIYDINDNKTNYYFPKNHNPEYSYQTFGDIYFTRGKAEFLNNYPPLIPECKDEFSDIYVGNVFLNISKPLFSYDKPQFVQKKIVEERYKCIETSPAPLRAMITSHLAIMESHDFGVTFSQPKLITYMVKDKKEKFFGTGPGVGISLKNQQNGKNGRILMPVYYLKRGYILISDDFGKTFRVTENNIGVADEIQLVELNDGRILAFGRQFSFGNSPYSVSYNSGESFSEAMETDLIACSCQKSVVVFPDSKKDVILCSHNSNIGRVDGRIDVGIVDSKNSIEWVSHINIENPLEYSCLQTNNFFGYSCLSVMKNNEIGLLYEPTGRNLLSFRKFEMDVE